MDIPTDLPRTRDPPEHDTQRPAATTPTAEPLQTPDEEAREILAKAIRNQAEDGPSTRRAAIRAYKSCMPWSVNTAHSSRRYMRPLKNTPHAARAPRKTLKYRAQPQELPAVPPQLTSELLHCLSTLPDPWPVSKMGRLFFADEYVQRPGDPNTAAQTPEIQSALKTVKGVRPS